MTAIPSLAIPLFMHLAWTTKRFSVFGQTSPNAGYGWMLQLFFLRQRFWVNARADAAELHAKLEPKLPQVPVGVPQSAKSMEMVALASTQKRLISP